MTSLRKFLKNAGIGELYKENDIYDADKFFQSFDEFINSKELENVHSGFQSKTFITAESFICAYVVGSDVFVNYKADGLQFLKKERIGSSLDNGGFYECFTTHLGFVINRNEAYSNCEENRRIWRKRKGTSSLVSVFL